MIHRPLTSLSAVWGGRGAGSSLKHDGHGRIAPLASANASFSNKKNSRCETTPSM